MNPERAGRDGLLKLRFERRGPDTILSQSRYALPLQALTPLTLDDGTAYLMLLNPTGGVLGGDRLVTEIVQGAGTRVCLTTPSATRVYRASGDAAVQETRIELKEGASIEYMPDHVIPHAGAALRQSLRIEMASGSRAVICDLLAAGRVAHGERWSFREIDSQMEVSMRGKLIFLNRAKINPGAIRPQRLGIMEGFNYMGCLAVFSGGPEDWESVPGLMSKALSRLPEVTAGVSLIAQGGCVVRYLANSAADLTRTNKTLWAVARESVLRLYPFDPRKY